MIRSLWFMIQMIVLAAGVWLVMKWLDGNPGTVHVSWMGYDIDAKIGFVLLALLIAALSLLILYRVWLALVSLPVLWRKRRDDRRRMLGQRALTLGLSAVAAGDARIAGYQAHRMRKFLPRDGGLPVLLEAQAARLRGDDLAARSHFETLMENKDTAFLGVRGLMQDAVDRGDLDAALVLARKAMAMHPKQPWIARTVFGLETQKHDWDAAGKTLKAAERIGAFTPDETKSARIAILMAMAENDIRAGMTGPAMKRLRDAVHANPGFAPAVMRLARLLIDGQKRRDAIRLIERAWKSSPHPDMIPVWDQLAPSNKANDSMVRMRWYERLVAQRPDHVESQIAAARAALEDGLWGEARQYLVMAENIGSSPRIYRLWSRLEDKSGHPEMAKKMLEKAADTPADPVWTCRQTGRIYDRWSPVAEPHGSFNTIVWGHPDIAGGAAMIPALAASADPLLSAPVRL